MLLLAVSAQRVYSLIKVDVVFSAFATVDRVFRPIEGIDSVVARASRSVILIACAVSESYVDTVTTILSVNFVTAFGSYQAGWIRSIGCVLVTAWSTIDGVVAQVAEDVVATATEVDSVITRQRSHPIVSTQSVNGVSKIDDAGLS